MELEQDQYYDQDYYLYQEEYDQARVVPRKPRTMATAPGAIEHNAPPLDFSFLGLKDVITLRKERPRAGTRKEIEKDEDEEDAKKEQLNPALANAADAEKGQEQKEQGVVITKASNLPQINSLLANHNVSLQTTNKNVPGGAMKMEQGSEEDKRKKKIDYVVNTILLNNNMIRELAGFSETLTYVLPHGDPTKLRWLNLSYNYLVKIDIDILNFPCLKTLSLHGNYINDLEEVRKLQELPELHSLTLNGNPIEEIKGYRLYVLGLMYAHNECLKKLDTVIISNHEFDNAIVWNERLQVSK